MRLFWHQQQKNGVGRANDGNHIQSEEINFHCAKNWCLSRPTIHNNTEKFKWKIDSTAVFSCVCVSVRVCMKRHLKFYMLTSLYLRTKSQMAYRFNSCDTFTQHQHSNTVTVPTKAYAGIIVSTMHNRREKNGISKQQM